MRANNTQVNLSNDRQKEYQRQQERLKAMAGTTDKVKSVSADIMIENLLKNSFKKPSQTPEQIERPDHLNLELPTWLQCESSMVPPQFRYLWSLVQLNLDLADTQKVSQLLLTSGLHVDVLGYIWNLANRAVPGQLTKQEFYIVLALVGLAQTGCTFNNLSVLKLIPAPSIPILQVNVLKNQLPQSSTLKHNDGSDLDSFQQFQNLPNQQSIHVTNAKESEKPNNRMFVGSVTSETNLFCDNSFDIRQQSVKKEKALYGSSKPIPEPLIEVNKAAHKNSNFPCIGSSPTAEFEDDFTEFQSVSIKKNETSEKISHTSSDSTEDFTEFQSANVDQADPFETVVIMQKREIPKIPLPKNFTGKLNSLKSNILKISPESERKLKVLSQSESLSSLPESKISSSNKVSTSISVLGGNHGIGSRLANHSLNVKLDRPKHHKHHKIKINPEPQNQPNTDEDMFLGVKPTNLENVIPKCCPKKSNCKTFILKETTIRNDETPEPPITQPVGNEFDILNSGENTRQIEIPMLGTFNETVLPTQTKPQPSGVDLISVQEDKYSALREIEIEMNQDKPEKESDAGEINDEFGDFLSADIPPPPPPPAVVPVSTSAQITDPNPVAFLLENEEKESWGEWNYSSQTNSNSVDNSVPVLDDFEMTNTKESSEAPPTKTESDLFGSFDLLNLSENDEKPNSSTASPLRTPQLDIFCEIETSSNLSNSVSLPKGESLQGLIFDSKPVEGTSCLSPQPKSSELANSQSGNEFWEFLTTETKPAATDGFSRHGSLPSLDLKMTPTEESEQEIVWRKCLESCHNLIQEGYEIFNNIGIKSVLDEVFSTPKTSDYLNNLNIVYQISKRVSQNCSEVPSTQEDLERVWGRLRDLSFEYNIKLKQEDKILEEKYQCSICLGYIGHDSITQGNCNYHPSCANLWINYVEDTLPCCT